MGITDAQEIVVAVSPLIVDAQQLQMSVYYNRALNAQRLSTNILPLVEDAQRLQATIINQDYNNAGEERLLAPDAAITFE